MSDTTTRHYHVAFGLAGYGPDAADSDGFPFLPSLRDAVQYAGRELVDAAEYLFEGATVAGDQQDYETAWLDFRHSEDLRNLAANADIDGRADAPLFIGPEGAGRLAATVEDIAAGFPVDLDRSGTRRLYLWECVESGCYDDADLDTYTGDAFGRD
jgi:hypothetical protein